MPLSVRGCADVSGSFAKALASCHPRDPGQRLMGMNWSFWRPRCLLGCATIPLVAAFLVPHAALGAAHHARAAQTEHFVFLTNNASSKAKRVVIATGPIHARGYDLSTGRLTDTLVFPQGSLFVRRTPTSRHRYFDKVTGYGTETETGSYEVTGGSAGYFCECQMGFGGYHLNVSYWVPKSMDKSKGFQMQIHAAGPLTLPR
jgi:hypothetical protein